ncbi:S-type pyocin domain-containing protein [Pseudomonas sp. GL-RE-29]|uniref:S-type pyocin domain-containing protein n=1 Tax=Pseudomonas sp. GL-RE-29 TaxID=2832375 RepID=UPI001CBF3D49|nr:S-type pyocin domain-containing protein [Pseudomonas sp. GL-RE-29]
MLKATKMEKWPGPHGIAMQALNDSLRAAIDTRLLSQTLQSLHQRTVSLQHSFNVMQAAEQARLAAEQEAQRVAVEQARIQAEAEALAHAQEQARLAAMAEAERVAAEQIRVKAEAEALAHAQEQVRLAALAEAERVAAEQARIAAEAAARYIAAEQARLEAEAEVQRQAERLRLENQRKAEEEAREHKRQLALLQAQAEALWQAEQARLDAQLRAETQARWQRPEFSHAGSMAAFGVAASGTHGTIHVGPAGALALRSALRAAIATITGFVTTAAAPILVGFAALLAPSRLGNGDLYSLSVPLSELTTVSNADLYELAVVGGEIDLPVTLGSKTIGNRVEIVAVATNGMTSSGKVPVRLAHFDSQKNVYATGGTDVQPATITWTPLLEPQNPSIGFPVTETDLPIYEGATLSPNEGRIDTFPQLDTYGFDGFITVFPIESGIPPLFILLRDRRQDPGVASGIGQEISGNWLGTASKPEGAPIPAEIADTLRGREFSSFRAFRRAFWKAVANDEYFFEQFSRLNKTSISHGLSPKSLQNEHVGQRRKYEIHHVIPIEKGGAVYDIDNLRILTPKQHIQTHSKKAQGIKYELKD